MADAKKQDADKAQEQRPAAPASKQHVSAGHIPTSGETKSSPGDGEHKRDRAQKAKPTGVDDPGLDGVAALAAAVAAPRRAQQPLATMSFHVATGIL